MSPTVEAPFNAKLQREYGSRATIGIAVPQANPTVEPEFWSLAPAAVSILTTRLIGSRTDSRRRLVDYLDNFQTSLDAYDIAPLDAVGFACTGTSYLIGADEEARRIDSFMAATGYPIITAAQAIRQSLNVLGIERIALFAPYPDWLVAACYEYWKAAGLSLVSKAILTRDTSDTRKVYDIGYPEVLAGVDSLDVQSADAIVMTGTGAPTLRAMSIIAERTGKPVLTSNFCLCGSLLAATDDDPAGSQTRMRTWLLNGWQVR